MCVIQVYCLQMHVLHVQNYMYIKYRCTPYILYMCITMITCVEIQV